MSISKDEIKKVANLAKLYVDDSNLDKLSADMEQVIAFADALAGVDTQGIDPTNNVMPVQNVFREDVVRPSMPREKLLQNAPSQENGCYSVPKVVE